MMTLIKIVTLFIVISNPNKEADKGVMLVEKGENKSKLSNNFITQSCKLK